MDSNWAIKAHFKFVLAMVFVNAILPILIMQDCVIARWGLVFMMEVTGINTELKYNKESGQWRV